MSMNSKHTPRARALSTQLEDFNWIEVSAESLNNKSKIKLLTIILKVDLYFR